MRFGSPAGNRCPFPCVLLLFLVVASVAAIQLVNGVIEGRSKRSPAEVWHEYQSGRRVDAIECKSAGGHRRSERGYLDRALKSREGK